MKANPTSLCLTVLLLTVLLLSMLHGASAQTLVNPGFEQTYTAVTPAADPTPAAARITGSDAALITGSIAPGWVDNTSWAKNVVLDYGPETNNPHSGTECQRITTKKGFAQFTQGVQFPAGNFRASVWMRAEPAQWVSLTIRLAGIPYTSYATVSVKAGSAWTQVNVTGTVPAVAGGLYVNTSSVGTVWVDDVKIVPAAYVAQKLSPPTGVIPRSYFGMNVNNMHTAPGYVWPVLDFGTYRSWDSGVIWASIETARGVYDWANLDKDVAQAQAHHAQVLFTLGQTPTWASSRPQEDGVYGKGYAAPPADINDWKDFVRAIATRYKGRIAAYEVWNEPDLSMFYSGTPAQLVALETATAEVVRQTDPKALIVAAPVSGGGGPGQLRFLDDYLAAGGGGSSDILAYHGYVYPAEQELESIQSTRAMLQSHGVGSKPLWNTETGTEVASIPETDAAAFVSRTLILDWALGLSRSYLYAYDGSFTGLDAPTADPKKRDPSQLGASGLAYAQTMRWLTGAKMLSCGSDVHGTWICAIIQANKTPAWLVWSTAGPTTFAIPPSWRVRNRSSVSIGIMPVLVSRT